MRHRAAGAWATVAVSGLLLAGCGSSTDAGSRSGHDTVSNGVVTVPKPTAGDGLHGSAVSPAVRLPSAALTDTGGNTYRMSAHGTGRLTVVYFGYTHCPDVCPATMARLSAALREVPPSVRSAVRVVFVTVDPRQDTPKVLRHWLDKFDTSFVGLTGATAAIENAQRALDLPVLPGAQQVENHSARTIVFGPDGTSVRSYLGDTSTTEFAQDLPRLAGRG